MSIIIVSYNTKEYLRRCLESLKRGGCELVDQVIVIDNRSTDGSVEMVEREFPEITLVRNPANLGYARAVNQGINLSGGRYFLILNPDIEAGCEAIKALWDFMERTPDAGIAAGKLLNPDGSLQMSCRTFYTFPVVLLRRTFLGRLFPRSRLVRDHLMLDWDHNSERRVDWVTGACMMVRREAYEHVGGMDERFFLYFEDVDWCYRMMKHGWKVYYVPSSVMVHHYRRESARLLPDRKLTSHLLSTFRFYDKWGSALYRLKRERRFLSVASTVVLDILLINLGFLTAFYLRYAMRGLLSKPVYPVATYRGLMVFVNLICLVSFFYSGLYRKVRRTTFVADLIQISRALLVSSLVIMAATYLTQTVAYSRIVVLLFWPISALLVAGGRAVQRQVHSSLRRGLFDLRRFAVVGSDDDAVELRNRLAAGPGGEYDFVGYISSRDATSGSNLMPALGAADQVGSIVHEHRVGEVFVCDRNLSRETMAKIVMGARQSGAEVRVVSGLMDMLVRGSSLEDVAGIPVVVFPPASLSGTRLVTKNSSDFAFGLLALAGLMLLAPVVFLYQTLTHHNYAAWTRGVRNLAMVLTGVRSLVGPLDWVGGERIKPGITGLWLTSTDRTHETERDRLDLYYIQNWSLSFDLEIMLLSVRLVGRLFGCAGASEG